MLSSSYPHVCLSYSFLLTVRPSVHLSASISTVPTARIYVKFVTADFHDSLLRKARFSLKKTETSDTLYEEINTFISSVATYIRCKSTVVPQPMILYIVDRYRQLNKHTESTVAFQLQQWLCKRSLISRSACTDKPFNSLTHKILGYTSDFNTRLE